jgi:hypothetical protein
MVELQIIQKNKESAKLSPVPAPFPKDHHQYEFWGYVPAETALYSTLRKSI